MTPEDLIRLKPYVYFAIGVICGYGSAKGWGSLLLVAGGACYLGGTLLSLYVRSKQNPS